MERLVIFSECKTAGEAQIRECLLMDEPGESPDQETDDIRIRRQKDQTLKEQLEAVEKSIIEAELHTAKGTKDAVRRLGLDRSTLNRKHLFPLHAVFDFQIIRKKTL